MHFPGKRVVAGLDAAWGNKSKMLKLYAMETICLQNILDLHDKLYFTKQHNYLKIVKWPDIAQPSRNFVTHIVWFFHGQSFLVLLFSTAKADVTVDHWWQLEPVSTLVLCFPRQKLMSLSTTNDDQYPLQPWDLSHSTLFDFPLNHAFIMMQPSSCSWNCKLMTAQSVFTLTMADFKLLNHCSSFLLSHVFRESGWRNDIICPK